MFVEGKCIVLDCYLSACAGTSRNDSDSMANASLLFSFIMVILEMHASS